MSGFQIRAAGGFGLALISGRVAQAAAFFIMARMLDEANMGLVSVLTIIYAGLFQLTNLGFDRYVVYCTDEDEDSLHSAINAVWSLQLIRTAVILLATAVMAVAFAGSGKFDLGTAHLLAIALAVVLISSISPDLSTHERNGNFSFIARARGYSALVGAATTIGFVLIWPSPWAFVIGQIVTSGIFFVQSFLYSTRLPRVSFSGADLSKVFNYCKHLLLIAVVSFLSAQIQNIYVGAMFSPTVLGVYFTWYRLVNLPRELVMQYATRLQFAKASADYRGGGDIMGPHLRGFAFTIVTLLPFHLFVWFHGDFLITFVAGPTWAPFWWGGQLMAIASMLQAMIQTIGAYTLVHLPHVSGRLRAGEAIATALFMVLLGPRFGLAGILYSVIIVMAIAMMIRVYLWYTHFVTTNRLLHARSMVFVLLVVAAPLLLVEAAVLGFVPAGHQSAVIGGAYLLVNGALFLFTVRRGGRLIGSIK